MLSQARNSWTVVLTVLFALVLSTAFVSQPHAQSTLTPDVTEALQRFTGGHTYASEAARLKDRALLFANNDAINAARLNNEITGPAYQAAQTDFDALNTDFGRAAATDANAGFSVQQRPADATFSPGTDSDYITVVGNKEQIGTMQSSYNNRVNDFLQENGAIDARRADWHNKLDTDFMADPRFVSEAEFREIAAMNNDAYRNRMAAEYERISRMEGGGKIGPGHVTGYAEEMSRFANRKRGKISDMFKKPYLFNDPRNRAKVIQMMAQEQKYISRIESLDDFLRKQEGLAPRSRGLTTAAKGARRQPHNVKNLKDAFSVAERSQGRALEELAETMGEVAKRNKAFRASAADDLAKIIAAAPPSHRAKALAALKRSNPKLARTVKGHPSLGSIDDLAAKGGKAARVGDTLSDTAKMSKARKSIGGFMKLLEAAGKLADAYEIAQALTELDDYFAAMEKALDPATPPDEVERLSRKAADIMARLAKSTALIHIMNANPTIAAAYGAWTLTCLAGEWLVQDSETGDVIKRGPTSGKDFCSRHAKALDQLADRISGKTSDIAAARQRKCDAFVRAYRANRVKKDKIFTVLDICNFIKYGVTIDDIVEYVRRPKKTVSGRDTTGGSRKCGPAKTAPRGPDKDGFIPQATNPDEFDHSSDCPPIGEAGKGDDGLTREKNTAVARADTCSDAQSLYQTARESYAKGDASAYRAGLIKAKQALSAMPTGACDGLGRKIARGHEQADVLDKINTSAGKLLGACKGDNPRGRAAQLRELSGLLSRTSQPHVQQLRRRLEAAFHATSAYADTKDAFRHAELNRADGHLVSARRALASVDAGDCPDLRAAVDKAPRVLEGWRDGIRKVAAITRDCNVSGMERYRDRLKGMSSPIAETLVARLNMALPDCRREKRSEEIAREREQEKQKPQYTCKDGYHPGPETSDGKVYCLPNKAIADAWCKQNNAKEGYHFAGKIQSDGSYDCIASKQTASAACRAANPGFKGVYAQIKNGGASYECKQTKKEAQRAARAAGNRACQRANNDRRARAGKYLGNGQWSCYIPGQRRTVTRRQQQPTVTPDDVARGAAILGGIINQMQKGSRRRRPQTWVEPPRPPRL